MTATPDGPASGAGRRVRRRHDRRPGGGRLAKNATLLIAAALVLCASASSADEPMSFPECTKQPSNEDVEAAKSLHQIATSRLNIQDYDKAIEFWRQAYALDCTAHPILQNIANAYEKKGDKRSAIVALETYIHRAPTAPDIGKVNDRVVELKKSLEPAPTATVSAAPTVTSTVTAAPTASAVVPGPRPYGSIPLLVAGVGGALAVAGAIMIPVGLGPYNEANQTCTVVVNGKKTCPKGDEDLVDSGNTGRITWNAGAAFLGIGVVAAAAGLGFHFVFNKPKDSATAAMPAPAASPAPSGAPSTAPSGAPAAPPPAAPPVPKASLDLVPVVGSQFGGISISGKF